MKKKKNINLEKLSRIVKEKYRKNKKFLFYHDWLHTELVRKYALELGEKCDADLEIVEAAALLHDIGYALNPETKTHEEDSIAFTRELSEDPDFSGLKQIIDKISECILATKQGANALTLNARIVKDADLIQFSTCDYSKKVFDLYNEIVLNNKDFDDSFRNFVKNTPFEMDRFLRKREIDVYSTKEARDLIDDAEDGYSIQKSLFEFLGNAAEDLIDIRYDEFYQEFLASLERYCKVEYQEILRSDFVHDLAKKCYTTYMNSKNVYNWNEKEKATLEKAELKINTDASQDAVIGYILREIIETIFAQAATIFLVGNDRKISFSYTYYHEKVQYRSRLRKKLLEYPSLNWNEGIVGKAIRRNKPQIDNDVSKNRDHYTQPSIDLGFPITTMVTIPITYYTKVIGAIQILNKCRGMRPFTHRDAAFLEKMSRITAFALQGLKII